ncbi:MAG: type I polyketide synthase [Polyangiales bacterium]
MTTISSIANEAVAIIGIGCWYPDAPNPARLWENILARRRSFRRLPAGRLPLDSYFDADKHAPDKTYGRKAAVIDGFDFDWVGRRIPRGTFEGTDIAHWLALEVALQSLDDAGYSRDTLPRQRTGVIVGNTLTGEQSRSLSLRVRWPFVERAIRAAAKSEGFTAAATDVLVGSTQTYFKSVFPPVDEDTLAGSLSNTIAGRICNFLDLQGGGYIVDGACASSLLAVTTAANVLSSRDLDVALVGGVDISLDPFELVGFAKVGALSPTQMRVYDRAANGFLPGEGCGFVVLKRLEDARADGDYVYATLRGWGVSSDGAGGITAPSVKGQSLAIRRAYKRAGYSPETLHFVEGHGTGTPAGDPVELKAIASAMKAYGVQTPRSCGITSFKSIVGHTKAAAGVGGFIKAAIAANRRVIPPTAGCTNPSATFADDARVLYALRNGRVESPDTVVRAGVSAMGFGGINAHVTLESGDPPASRLKPSLDEEVLLSSAQDSEIFVISATSVDALKSRVEQVVARGDGLSMGELADFAAELSVEVKPGASARAAIVASDPEELEATLGEVLEALREDPPEPGTVRLCSPAKGRAWIANAPQRPRVGFLFPGQGSQQLAMARRLVRRFDWAKRFVEQADGWLLERGHEPVTELIYQPLDRARDDDQILGWRETLRQTQHAQPAICLASVLWLKYLARLGVTPAVVAGHSLGELSALHAAGAFDERTLMQLAATRGELMAVTDVSGTMASLACGRAEADQLIAEASGYCTIANLNAPRQTVISGDVDAVERIVEMAKARSIAAVRLQVSGAFHSAHFQSAAGALREAEGVPEISAPLHTAMLSAIDGAPMRTGVPIRDYLSRQMRSEVDFVSLVRSMADRCDLLLEVGPGRVLSGLVKGTVGDDRLRCFPVESQAGNDEDLNLAVAALFAHGQRLRLDALYDSRLCRPFVPASERRFIENPCERPFPDVAAGAAGTVVVAPAERAFTLIPPPPDSLGGEPELPHRQVAESQLVMKPTVRSAVLAGIGAQTGFPIESLTLDLRLVDDLHLDSIKTVELVSDLADQLGITEAFDAAQFADATLGELVERMELLEANATSGPSNGSNADRSASGIRSKDAKPWVANYALHWEAEPLPKSLRLSASLEGRVLVLTQDSNDPLVLGLVQELSTKDAVVSVREGGDGDEDQTQFDHLLVLCPDLSASADAEALSDVVDLLTGAARLLPSAASARNRAPSFSFVCLRSSDASGQGHYDWSPDAFAAAVHLERRQLRVRSLEFLGAEGQPARVAETLVAELADERAFASARYDAKGRRLIGKPRLQSRAAYSARANSIGADDVVLVTGGAKGITARCALALARETGATMVLVGSSPMPDAAHVSAGADEIRATLSSFGAEGLRCEYRQCDLTERQDVQRLVANVRSDFGSLDAVVHGAGLNQPRRVEEPNPSEVLNEIAPKLMGALHLFEALEDAPPKLFVALTSVIGVVGMPQNAWYAFANQALDRSLGRFAARHASVESVSLAYSVWDEVGMGAKLGSVERLAKLGIDAIPVEEGAARFVELVTRDPGVREVVVTARLGALDTWQPLMPPLPRAHRFVDRILSLDPGRELVCRTKLDLERDPYVRDHVYEGSHLLPAVFGLEAMAEAVAFVTGQAELPFPLSIEDVELTRPLVVHPDRGLEIEIHAEVENDDAGMPDRQCVLAKIRCQQTGFEQSHFAARFVLGASGSVREQTVEIPTAALPLRPREHLYGSVLFQGPRFQRIDEVNALDAKHCLFAANQGHSDETWLLGDPYFRDALLQSLQLCVVPDQCLPVRIDRWDIVDAGSTKPTSRVCKATIDGKDGDTYLGTVSSVSTDGKPIELLSGYRARTLLRRPDWPAADELAARGSTSVLAALTEDSETGATEQAHRVHSLKRYGYQNQDTFSFRFPLTAQDSQSATRSLYFTRFFKWMGKMREVCGLNTPGAYVKILDMLRSNEITSATNAFETTILSTPRCNDIIEGRLWVERASAVDCDAVCEWWAIPFAPNQGDAQLFAWSHMTISAVEVLPTGAVRATKWPDYFYGFLELMGPRGTGASRAPSNAYDHGVCHFKETPGPRATGVLLADEVFDTSFEDGNVVGNIYFATYGVWQGRVRDRFFYELSPGNFCGRPDAELICTNFRMTQLREAMPFDRVRVEMRMVALYERAADLSFQYFRVAPDGSETKLAVGEHTAGWATPVARDKVIAKNWPSEIIEGLLNRAAERRPMAS